MQFTLKCNKINLYAFDVVDAFVDSDDSSERFENSENGHTVHRTISEESLPCEMLVDALDEEEEREEVETKLDEEKSAKDASNELKRQTSANDSENFKTPPPSPGFKLCSVSFTLFLLILYIYQLKCFFLISEKLNNDKYLNHIYAIK